MSTDKPSTPTSVETLLPHRGHLRLVDELLDYDGDAVRVALTVRDEPPFGDGSGRLPAYLGIEYMAQTAAVFGGLEMRAQGQPPKVALLIGTRRYGCRVGHFDAGQRLTVMARLKHRDESDLCMFACSILDAAGATLAEADVKAYRPDDIHDFLAGAEHQ